MIILMVEQDLINLITCSLMVILMGVTWFFAYHQGEQNERRKHIPLVKKESEIKPPRYWNYRVGTRLVKHVLRDEMWREYLIIECHYENEVPRSYGESNKMDGYEELHELKSANSLMSTAFEKEVLNLDDFPNVFKE
jgi:hypothetical protein